jgi:hypothetical protein
MAAQKDKSDEGAAGPETSLASIDKGECWEALERLGLNTQRDNPVDDYQRAQGKAAVAKLLNEADSPERAASASATTSRHEQIDPVILERVQEALQAARTAKDAFAAALCGSRPEWVHAQTWRQVESIRERLEFLGFTSDQILGLAARADEMFVPGIVVDSVAFIQDVTYLAHVRYAVSLGHLDGPGILYGNDAALGAETRERRRKGGRKSAEKRSKSAKIPSIRYLISVNQTDSAIAKRVGVSRQYVGQIRKKRDAELRVKRQKDPAGANAGLSNQSVSVLADETEL